MSRGVAATQFAMYRCARMLRCSLCCAALVLVFGCTPKQVESPLEKAPPTGIAEARELAEAGDFPGAQNAYEKFVIEHPGTAEADLARLELGVLNAALGRCEAALPQFEQAQDSADRAIALRASLRLGTCQLDLGDPDRALRRRRAEHVRGRRRWRCHAPLADRGWMRWVLAAHAGGSAG